MYPALCSNCGTIFRNTGFINLTGSGFTLHMEGNIMRCPLCKGDAHVVDGVFHYLPNGQIAILAAPQKTLDLLQQIGQLARDALQATEAEQVQVLDVILTLDEKLGPGLLRKLPKSTPAAQLAIILLYVTLLSVAGAGVYKTFKDVITQEEVVRAYDQTHVHNDNSTHVHNDNSTHVHNDNYTHIYNIGADERPAVCSGCGVISWTDTSAEKSQCRCCKGDAYTSDDLSDFSKSLLDDFKAAQFTKVVLKGISYYIRKWIAKDSHTQQQVGLFGLIKSIHPVFELLEAEEFKVIPPNGRLLLLLFCMESLVLGENNTLPAHEVLKVTPTDVIREFNEKLTNETEK